MFWETHEVRYTPTSGCTVIRAVGQHLYQPLLPLHPDTTAHPSHPLQEQHDTNAHDAHSRHLSSTATSNPGRLAVFTPRRTTTLNPGRPAAYTATSNAKAGDGFHEEAIPILMQEPALSASAEWGANNEAGGQ
jgi:hypothetical protein